MAVHAQGSDSDVVLNLTSVEEAKEQKRKDKSQVHQIGFRQMGLFVCLQI